MRAPPPVGNAPQENADWRRDKQTARDATKNALTAGLTAAAPSMMAGAAPPPMQNALALVPPSQTVVPPQAPSPVPSPSPDPNGLFARVMQHIAGQNMSPGDLDQRMATNIEAMHHLGRLLEKGDRITKQDAAQAAIEAAKAGAISSERASWFIEHVGDTPPEAMVARLQGVMSDLVLASAAYATVKQQAAPMPQQGR